MATIDPRGKRKLEKEFAKKFSTKIKVDTTKPEAQQVAYVEAQLRAMGTKPNRAEVLKLVRAPR